MKKIFIIFLAAALVAGACSKNDRLIYDDDAHDVYFGLVTSTRDSLYISLLTADPVSEHNINIRMLGTTLDSPLRFAAEVVPEKTTAVEGVHYRKLPEYYEFPAGVFEYRMPVKLLNDDPYLEQNYVTLAIRLKSISQLGIAYPDQDELRVIFSNMLRKPEDTDAWVFENLFGAYSQVKHRMIIDLTGHDFWDGNYGKYGGANGIYYEMAYYTPYARILYKTIIENDIYDENGNRIAGWNVP